MHEIWYVSKPVYWVSKTHPATPLAKPLTPGRRADGVSPCHKEVIIGLIEVVLLLDGYPAHRTLDGAIKPLGWTGGETPALIEVWIIEKNRLCIKNETEIGAFRNRVKLKVPVSNHFGEYGNCKENHKYNS